MDDDAPSTTGPAERKVPKNPPTIDMVKMAISELSEPRKGCSVMAIKNWVASHYPEVDQGRFKGLMKKALTKALEDEVVVRPANSKGSAVMQGSYKMGKPQKDATKKPAAKKVAAKKTTKAESAGRSRTPKKKMLKKTGRRSMSLGATPKPKKSRSKMAVVPARRAVSHSPEKTPRKSPKAAKRAPKKTKTPTKKAAKAKSPSAKPKAAAKKAAKKSPVPKEKEKEKKKPAKKAAPKKSKKGAESNE